MAVFQCKMCGGTMKIQEGATIAECEYCGMKQTLPRLTDERRENLYERANHFRRNNDYDKAMAVYEDILKEDTTDAEAYWSIVLCRYGIEYVEDPATKKLIPTVNRMQYTSILADEDYRSALKYADGAQKNLYEAEAKEIDGIQKGILAISQSEEPFDVFICYKETDSYGRRTRDSVLAQELYYGLKQEGFKVFFARITLEDKLGSAYEPYIFAALNSAKAMIVLGTKPEHFNAVWVKNEWSRYLSLIKKGERKTLIPAYRDMDPYELPEEFSHLQAQDMTKLGFMQDLIRGVKKILSEQQKKTERVVQAEPQADFVPQLDALIRRAFILLEDGEFKKADEYCEKALLLDSENAKAYIGKLMAEHSIKTQEELADAWRILETNNNYIRAVRFADENTAAELKAIIENGKEKERLAAVEREYQAAVAAFNRAKLSTDYQQVGRLFANLGDYKDAAEMLAKCQKKEKEVTLKSVYEKASGLSASNDETNVEKAMKIFKRLKNYLDSEQRAVNCENKLKYLQALRVEEEKVAAKREKRTVIVGICVVGILVLAAIASITISTAIGLAKKKEVEKAEKLAAKGEYAQAYEQFERLGKESTMLAQACKLAQAGEYAPIVKYYDYTTFVVPAGTTKVNAHAFSDCDSLTSVEIPDSVTSIGDYAFSYCDSLTSIVIPDSVTSIGDDAFYDCESLTSITIPDSVTSIGRYAFASCDRLTSVEIPDSVTLIGERAFYNCSSLTSITIPDSVTSIGSGAFQYCRLLTIYCEAESKPSGWDAYWNVSNCPVHWDTKVNKTKNISSEVFFVLGKRERREKTARIYGGFIRLVF
ncbi:MAG: leucine-rich repeat protein [Clostridia bacterium]|nr:leucine-rich repeat protein [Clostridia bacterium]